MRIRVVVITVAAAGTPEVGPALLTKKVQLRARVGNSGLIYYGGSNICASRREEMVGGEQHTYEAPVGESIDLSDLRIDASNNDDQVALAYFLA